MAAEHVYRPTLKKTESLTEDITLIVHTVVCLWPNNVIAIVFVKIQQKQYKHLHAYIVVVVIHSFITLRAKLSGAVYCYRSCLCVCVFATGERAVSEPYYSQRARSVCVSERFFIHSFIHSFILLKYKDTLIALIIALRRW